jgi:glyoxylase-like metal-dependent hydrolase (beta-lactamase superfamily II)
MKPEFTSKHFVIEEISVGVYVALGMKGERPQMANSGIIDLGERTLVFDTGLTPYTAQDLRKVAIEITGRDPTYVVNSHWHDDIYGGTNPSQDP